MNGLKNQIRKWIQNRWEKLDTTNLSAKQLDPNLEKSFKRFTNGLKSHWLPPKLLRLSYKALTVPFNQISPKIATKDLTGPRPIRHYISPTGNKDSMIYIHGGGFVIGDINSHDTLCRIICEKSGLNVFSIDYRRGPEHRFPTPIADCILCFNWIKEHQEEWGLKGGTIGMGGDSAGATATMVIEQAFHQNSKFLPKPQQRPDWMWLMYPLVTMEKDFDQPDPSRQDSFLSRNLTAYFRKHYLPKYSQSNCQSMKFWEVAPKFGNWDNAIPTTVFTVEHDPLTAGTLSWLDQIAFDYTHIHFDHLYHEFVSMGGVSELAKSALDQSIEQIGKLNELAQSKARPALKAI